MFYKEFDACREAVINPGDILDRLEGLPKVCIGAFSKELVERAKAEYGGEEIGALHSCCGDIPIYRIRAKGAEFALFLPMIGSAAAGACMEELIAMGAESFVFFGACGVLHHGIADGHLIVPTAAVRDEGFSYHYLPAADEVGLDADCVEAAKQAMEELGYPYVEGKTWTTDAIYRETRAKIERRKAQGCICVEMECACEFNAPLLNSPGVCFANVPTLRKLPPRHMAG